MSSLREYNELGGTVTLCSSDIPDTAAASRIGQVECVQALWGCCQAEDSDSGDLILDRPVKGDLQEHGVRF